MNLTVRKKIVLLCFCASIVPIYYFSNMHINKNSEVNKLSTSTITKEILNYDEDISENICKVCTKKAELIFKADNSTSIENFGVKYTIDGKTDERPNFSFSNGNSYSKLEGVTCFRGNNFRDSGSYGKVRVNEKKLNILWEKTIGAIDSWTGVGWNGQPAIVKWDSSVIKDMNFNNVTQEAINNDMKDDGLKEVLYATLDGNVYFLNLENGSETREKLKIGAPIKGSLTVDPRGIPLLYVGQGIEKNGNSYVDFAYRIFSLTNFEKLYEINGNDNFAGRSWGAFDSTALIDDYNDYIFICGENGLVYSGALNSKYENGKININPKISKYRYDIPMKERKGIESSIAIYKNYGFFADNDGILQCLDLHTLTPIWIRDVNDDTDSTVVLEKEKETLSLYTACEVDHQGNNGFSYVRKIDATNGNLIWENKYECAYNEDVNGGALATPIVGKEDISNLVIFNIARHPFYNSGILVAIDKISGKEVWKLNLNNYCWSSPVALYTYEGKSYIIGCDSNGTAMLIEGMSGKILDKLELGANVEGSPAAFGNTLVVGTRGGKIIGFQVK